MDADYSLISASEFVFNPNTDIIFSHPSISISLFVTVSKVTCGYGYDKSNI